MASRGRFSRGASVTGTVVGTATGSSRSAGRALARDRARGNGGGASRRGPLRSGRSRDGSPSIRRMVIPGSISATLSKRPAIPVAICTKVSFSRTRIAPIPSLVMPPASQTLGNSHRASARPVWPTESVNQTEGPNSPRSRGADGAMTCASPISSGAERPSRHSRMKAEATCSGPKRDSRVAASAASSPGAWARTGCSISRESSRARTSSADGALPHSATTFAPCKSRCAFL